MLGTIPNNDMPFGLEHEKAMHQIMVDNVLRSQVGQNLEVNEDNKFIK